MITESSSVVRLLPTVSREWLYTILSLVLGIIACAWYRVADQYDKSIEADRVVPTKRLWTSREIPFAFAPASWQRQAFEAFRARMLMQDPQIFPCIYATKGFKANEHRCCFIDHRGPNPRANVADTTLDTLGAAFDEYARNWRQYGPMTSLVVLTPLPSLEGEAWQPSLEDDRKRFWGLLRAISDRDLHGWPAHVPQDVGAPAWTLEFGKERFVGLALTPRYQKRQSRFCQGFAMAFQPIDIFQDLLSTPEKMASAVGKVRALTDSLDMMPYSKDVIAVSNGKQSVSTMFFLSDDGESWNSLYSRIRSG